MNECLTAMYEFSRFLGMSEDYRAPYNLDTSRGGQSLEQTTTSKKFSVEGAPSKPSKRNCYEARNPGETFDELSQATIVCRSRWRSPFRVISS